MAKPKKPTTTFEAVFEGPGVYPEVIPLSQLARVLSAVQRLAAGYEAGDEEEEVRETPEWKIGLLNVRRGSAVYGFAAPVPAVALGNLRETGEALERPERIEGREYILGPVEELSAIARS